MNHKPEPQGLQTNGDTAARIRIFRSLALALYSALLCASPCYSAPPQRTTCARVELTGLVNAGQEWETPLGQGWVFRVIPIVPGPQGYTGWDLVVDRDPPAGYPDALLLATPPYHSVNEREIGTTFGLRSQDAIGWNPRSFHFLTNPAAFFKGQKLFLALSSRLHAPGGASQKSDSDPDAARLTHQLMAMLSGSAAGELRILDAGLAPGTADPAPFARNWARRAAYTSYTLIPESTLNPTPLGELGWMRFSITLWLPSGWKLAPGLTATSASCQQ